jgi:hypothetical protein
MPGGERRMYPSALASCARTPMLQPKFRLRSIYEYYLRSSSALSKISDIIVASTKAFMPGFNVKKMDFSVSSCLLLFAGEVSSGLEGAAALALCDLIVERVHCAGRRGM